MNYNDRLAEAIEFTKSLGADVPEFNRIASTLVTPENGAACLEAFNKHGIKNLKCSAGQCLKWSMALKNIIAKASNCEILVTVGQLSYFGKPAFNPTQEDFRRWYRQGFSPDEFIANRGLNLHAWYSLPSGEILDFTLSSTLAVLYTSPEHAGLVTGGWPDEIAPNPTYIPIVVGEDVILTIQEKTNFNFLAASVNMVELSAFPIHIF